MMTPVGRDRPTKKRPPGRLHDTKTTDVDLARAALAVSPCTVTCLAASLRILPRRKGFPRPRSDAEAKKRARAAFAALMLLGEAVVRNELVPETQWVFMRWQPGGLF